MAEGSNTPQPAEFDSVFKREVFGRELKDVRNRLLPDGDRRLDGLPDFEKRLLEGDKRSPILNKVLKDLQSDAENEAWRNAVAEAKEEGIAGHDGLIGLALSGGGIRSATFNLGVIQALKRCGLFDCIDYLSTVSGGGYIGSCLSSLYTSTSQFPFGHQQGVSEPAAFRHLRNNANYLAPKGLLDLLRIPALLFRGVVINFLIILPYILLAVLITIAVKPTREAMYEHLLVNIPPFSWIPGENFLVTKALAAVIILSYALYPLFLVIAQKFNYFGVPQWESRNLSGRAYSGALALIAVVAFVELQPHAILYFGVSGETVDTGGWFARVKNWFTPDVVTGLGLVGSVIAALFSAKLSEKVSGMGGRLGIYLVATVSFIVFWLIYLNLFRWALYLGAPHWLTALSPDWLITLIVKTGRGVQYFAVEVLAAYIVVAVGLWLYSAFVVDVNYTSLHNFYRDRLSKAYLIRVNAAGRIEHNDTQRLSELNTKQGPYHLINAALNVQKMDEAYLRGRHADFFVFSKHYIGGKLTGYCKTKDMEAARRHVNLGTAIAISGAAAAPAMGKATIRPLVFIMAMLNVRLNYWLPNPRWIAMAGLLTANPTTRPGPSYLIWELLGRLNAYSWNVNLSDGGHIENLGVYELLRRECRLIIAGDGECDPELKFEAVSEVMRMAQIDLGIEIEMDGLDEIRIGMQHHAVGTIHYPGGRTGKLIYLKSSLLGDDALNATLTDEAYVTSRHRNDDRLYNSNAYIAHYKANNPAFPHESTGDQFFDETQFECYRALGYQVAMRTFGA